ncbi:hypothetical protein RSAG8_10094, partial [Rhizoctonia solani AG-8 WAC10335]
MLCRAVQTALLDFISSASTVRLGDLCGYGYIPTGTCHAPVLSFSTAPPDCARGLFFRPHSPHLSPPRQGWPPDPRASLASQCPGSLPNRRHSCHPRMYLTSAIIMNFHHTPRTRDYGPDQDELFIYLINSPPCLTVSIATTGLAEKTRIFIHNACILMPFIQHDNHKSLLNSLESPLLLIQAVVHRK